MNIQPHEWVPQWIHSSLLTGLKQGVRKRKRKWWLIEPIIDSNRCTKLLSRSRLCDANQPEWIRETGESDDSNDNECVQRWWHHGGHQGDERSKPRVTQLRIEDESHLHHYINQPIGGLLVTTSTNWWPIVRHIWIKKKKIKPKRNFLP